MSETPADGEVAKKERGLLSYIGLGLSWGLLALVSLVAVAVILVPALTKSTPYTIITGSMVPTYPPGTLVIVRPVAPEDIQIGTVITYQIESGEPDVVTHRVIAIVQPNQPGAEIKFITKGDANDAPDAEPVQPVQIRGEVWYSVPWIGWVNNVINGDMRAVMIPVLACALFLYAGYQLVTGIRDKRRANRELETPTPADG